MPGKTFPAGPYESTMVPGIEKDFSKTSTLGVVVMREALLASALTAALVVPSFGATIIVDPNGAGNFTAIQPAIDGANEGDIILVTAGEYRITEPVTFRGKAITVRASDGPDRTTIRMSENPTDRNRASVVIFENGEGESSILDGFTLTKGKGSLFNNQGVNGGGGVVCAADCFPTLTNCRIKGNSAGFGGGVYSDGGSHPTFRNCTISGNTATSFGGGVYCGRSFPTFTNCTISGNTAVSLGGGVHSFRAGPVLTNCTITGNSRSAVYYTRRSASPTLTNCIVWANVGQSIQADSAKGEDAVDATYCCIESDTVWPGVGNINQDPRFVQPGSRDNHGTPDDPSDDVWNEGDYRLKPDSPCIDSGTSQGAPATDVRGNRRPCGAGVDIGAYERGDCPASTSFRRGDPNADGTRNITDAVFTLLFLFSGGSEPPCRKSADSDDNGRVDLTDAVFLLDFLFRAGKAPDVPFPDCGTDLTIDALTCDSYPACP